MRRRHSGHRTFFGRPHLLWFVLLSVAQGALEANVVFPQDSGVLDVTQPPFNATGDGRTDDTSAIQEALDAYPSGNRIIYLPNGTYLISAQLRWPPSSDEQSRAGNAHKRTIMQGQSRDGVTIQLMDSAPGFQQREVVTRKGRTRTRGRGVIWTGTAPAQRFRNAIRDLTISIGSGNPAACGLQFHANNQGTIRNVAVISDDGQGLYGFDFGFTGEIGPLLARNISVRGFDYGIYHAALNMVTFEHVSLANQNTAAIYNSGVMPIRGLKSRGTSPVFEHAANNALVLIDAQLSGQGGSVFSERPRRYYVRDVDLEGFDHVFEEAVDQRDDRDVVLGEVASAAPARLLSTSDELIRLPIKETPDVPLDEDVSRWANPIDYGAVGDGKTDDTIAIQAAIDDPEKSTVYLPGGMKFRIGGTLFLRGSIERFFGCEGSIKGSANQPGEIVVTDGEASTVVIERLDCSYSGLRLSIDTSRVVVISSTTGIDRVTSSGSGDLFVDDVVCGPITMTNSEQSIWMRQINTESKHAPNLQNRGATLWVLGHKTENGHTKVQTTAGGRTEVYGAHIYANQRVATPYPLFEVIDAELTAVGVRQTFWPPKTKPFEILLRETRNGVTKELTRGDNETGASLPVLIAR